MSQPAETANAKTEWMDTRCKIVDAAKAAESLPPGALVVSGHFDPLLAAHAAQLRKLSETAPGLAVIVTEPAAPILSARARAELVAALACVDIVLLDAPGVPQAELSLEAGHAALNEAFVERVQKNQS